MYSTNMFVNIPNTDRYLTPGCRIKLGRFETITWIVQYGWYAYGGNRPTLGWYLVNDYNDAELKPLFNTDLDDCYMIEN